MKIISTRSLNDLRAVLQNSDATGPDPVYQVYAIENDPNWANQTIISPGKIGLEYPKTFGHYHGSEIEETYRLQSGQGVFLLQSKKMIDGAWQQNQVDKVYLIKALPSDEITITPKWGHSWSNIGPDDLITVDNWRAGHSPADYQVIQDLRGMAYYLLDRDGQLELIPNPNYQNLPIPEWISANDFKNLS